MTPVQIFRHTSTNPWTYSLLDSYQKELAEKAREGEKGKLILSEVSPVISVSRRTEASDFTMSREALAGEGIEVYSSTRGGLATYHGPGQWLLFPVESMESLVGDPRGVKKVISGLLEIAWKVARDFQPRAEVRSGCELGVWSPFGKLASVGVHIDRGILQHGLALNVFRTETSFKGIRPCGLDAPVDFLLNQKQELAFLEIGQRLIQETFKTFRFE